MAQTQITYPDKITGNTFSGAEATEVKATVNANATDVQSQLDSKASSSSPSFTGDVELTSAPLIFDDTAPTALPAPDANKGSFYFDKATNKMRVTQGLGGDSDIVQDLSGYAPLAGPSFTGDVGISSTQAILFGTAGVGGFINSSEDNLVLNAGGGGELRLEGKVISDGILNWEIVSVNTATVNGGAYFADCSGGALTLTLPASPTIGHRVAISDFTGNASTNNVTIGRNGRNIDSSATDLILDLDKVTVELVYSNSTVGWVITKSTQVL